MKCRAVCCILMFGLAVVIAAARPAQAAESKNYVYKDLDVRTDRVVETELKSITVAPTAGRGFGGLVLQGRF